MLLISMVWALLFSDHSYRTYRHDQAQSLKLKQQIAELQQQREQLAKEILRLRNDPKEQERVIHERLGYVHPDEYIVLHPEGAPP